MKFVRITVMLAVLASTAAIFAASASAQPAAGYRWPTDEKWAFIGDYTDSIEYDGYRYPNLYAECLQKAAAKMFRSYSAWVNAPDRVFGRWVKSPAVGHCMLVYGKKYWD